MENELDNQQSLVLFRSRCNSNCLAEAKAKYFNIQ